MPESQAFNVFCFVLFCFFLITSVVDFSRECVIYVASHLSKVMGQRGRLLESRGRPEYVDFIQVIFSFG